MLEENTIRTEHLIEFLKNLEEGKIVNPISENLAIELPAHFHRELFQKHIDTTIKYDGLHAIDYGVSYAPAETFKKKLISTNGRI